MAPRPKFGPELADNWHESLMKRRDVALVEWFDARRVGVRGLELDRLARLAADARESRRLALATELEERRGPRFEFVGASHAVKICGDSWSCTLARSALGCIHRRLTGPTKREILDAYIDGLVEDLDPFDTRIEPDRVIRKTRRGCRGSRKKNRA